MRGLPACGKSHTARELAGEHGVVCETDAYFHSEVGDDPEHYDYHEELLEESRRWNFERFARAVDAGAHPVVVDRGGGRSLETQKYARLAIEHGYEVRLAEPTSPWWNEIAVLLKYKRYTKPVLMEWAAVLTKMSRATHRVPETDIRRRMSRWKHDLTVQEILDFDPERGRARKRKRSTSRRDAEAASSGADPASDITAHATKTGSQ